MEGQGMSVNSFNHEDEISAAYDAAERGLWHALDSGALQLPGGSRSEKSHEEVRAIARRIAEAVIHSSAKDIVDMGLGVQVEHAEMWI